MCWRSSACSAMVSFSSAVSLTYTGLLASPLAAALTNCPAIAGPDSSSTVVTAAMASKVNRRSTRLDGRLRVVISSSALESLVHIRPVHRQVGAAVDHVSILHRVLLFRQSGCPYDC